MEVPMLKSHIFNVGHPIVVAVDLNACNLASFTGTHTHRLQIGR